MTTATTRRVLIIEDHNDVADLEKLLCQMEGYEVQVAKDGDSGWKALSEFRPHLVLLDLMLPGSISGHDILARLQEQDGKTPKVIVVSALMNSRTTARVLRPGRIEAMEKPFTINALAAHMKALLESDALAN